MVGSEWVKWSTHGYVFDMNGFYFLQNMYYMAQICFIIVVDGFVWLYICSMGANMSVWHSVLQFVFLVSEMALSLTQCGLFGTRRLH